MGEFNKKWCLFGDKLYPAYVRCAVGAQGGYYYVG